MTEIPAWKLKHPCVNCRTGYGVCSEGWKANLMCCAACKHPTRWQDEPWTPEELIDMWVGQTMPGSVQMHLGLIPRDAGFIPKER